MRLPDRQEQRRILRFLGVGVTSVAIDAAVYALLLALGAGTVVAKPVGYVSGAVFSYFANWRFTFGLRRGRFSELLFVAVYASSLLINLGVNEVGLALLGDFAWRAPLMFFVTTAITAVWNYLGMSRFVFTSTDIGPGRTDDVPMPEEADR